MRSVVGAGAERAAVTLRLVRMGGDTVLWGDIESLRSWLTPGAHIQVIYAATEAPMLQWFVEDSCRSEDARVPIGYPLPGNRLAIVGKDGELGELTVSSPYVSLGSRIFRTGDLARQRPDGLLERVGRKDRQVKIRGVRVHLEGVEALLSKHPLVRDVAAHARTNGINGATTLVAYISARDHSPAGLVAELRALMRSAPAAMRPARFYLVNDIPRLPSSKLDACALGVLDDVNVEKERTKPTAKEPVSAKAGDRIAQTVARVWQEVLLANVSEPDDDFFDAGGDSLKAILFASQLERILGLQLSPTLIYEAPTFGAFCEMLREYRALRHGPLVILKAGTGSPPLFFIHGVGGNVVELLPTARRMTYPGAVIGIRARGLARGEVAHSSVEAMAADYLKEIKARQPRGPYHLCGFSFGGLVAFEIARRLAEAENEVAFVGLLDTSMSPLRWPLKAWLSIIGGRIAHLPGKLRIPASLPASVLRVSASALLASARYRPGFFGGQLTLFTPMYRAPGLPSLEALWRKHARAIASVETEGEHLTMLSAPNADSTAEQLTHCLSQVPGAE
jgi:thioesterase domain-containing protein/acyl carrier protein